MTFGCAIGKNDWGIGVPYQCLPGLHLNGGELLQRQHIGPGPEGGSTGGCAGAEAVLHQDQGVQRAQPLDGRGKEGEQTTCLFLQTMF